MVFSLEKSVRSMRELGLPTLLSQDFMELTFSSGPCTWPVTVPLLVFFTQPTTPIFLASPSVYILKQTPCTLPNTS